MKIALVQTKSVKGNIERNIINHSRWVEIAVSEQADMVVFPELSLTGYEPELAQALATDIDDLRLERFQQLSDRNDMTIGVGLPTRVTAGIFISMVIFTPNQARSIYSKQKLHSDEIPYFIPGDEQIILTIKDSQVALAICYESLLSEHAETAQRLGAEIYVASVAKSQTGVKKAFDRFPTIAAKCSMTVLMANCVGFCDSFESAGQSAVWDKNGILLGQLDSQHEGLLVFNNETNELIQR